MKVLFYCLIIKAIVSFSFNPVEITKLKHEPRILNDFEKKEYSTLFEHSNLAYLSTIDFFSAERIIDHLLVEINTKLNGLFKEKLSMKQQNDLRYKLNLIKAWALNNFHLQKFNNKKEGILTLNSNSNFVFVNQGYFQFEKFRENKVMMTWGAGPCVILIVKGYFNKELTYGLAHFDSDSVEYLNKGFLASLLSVKLTQLTNAYIISGNISDKRTIQSTFDALSHLINDKKIYNIKINKDVVDAGVSLVDGQVYLLNPYQNVNYNIDYSPLIEISKQLSIKEPTYFLDKNYGNFIVAPNALYLGKHQIYEIYKNKDGFTSKEPFPVIDDMTKVINKRN